MDLNKFKPKRRSIKEWIKDIDKIKLIGSIMRFFEMVFYVINKIIIESIKILRMFINRLPKITFFVSIVYFFIFYRSSVEKIDKIIEVSFGDFIAVISISILIVTMSIFSERIELSRIKRFIDNFKETFSYRYVRK
tara:strand:+ start:1295 stop:1702 length:408 start_codon:yes stop_codon:yes gene_type:complete